MKKDGLYSIGEVSRLCDISQRMIRYYEKIGIVEPAAVEEQSGYRYYSIENIKELQQLKYFIGYGFTINEISKFKTGMDLETLKSVSLSKLGELKKDFIVCAERLNALQIWYKMMIKGTRVIKYNKDIISVKYIPKKKYIFLKGECSPHDYERMVYLETEFFTLCRSNGPTTDIIEELINIFDSYTERMEDTYKYVTVTQVIQSDYVGNPNIMDYGGCMAVTGFHIGSCDTIKETYERIIKWSKEKNITLTGQVMEKQIVEHYMTNNYEEFVTEIILPIEEKDESSEFYFNIDLLKNSIV